MSEQRLRQLLREAPVPGAEAAERRGALVVAEAFAGRERARASAAPRRLAIAFAVTLALAALVLSPAGASVRNWVGDVFATASAPTPGPALTEVPGGGRLLVQSGTGPWVVQHDGSRRLLGRYEEATWSPHGLYVAATAGHTLSAIEPDGTAHWSLSAPGAVSDPRWSPSGWRIAFRSGRSLRVVHADGTDDAQLGDEVAAVAPVWSPLGVHQLAFVEGGRLQLLDADTRRPLGSAPALAGVATLGWAPAGSPLLEASPQALRTRPVAPDKLAGKLRLGAPRPVPLPPGATVEAASFSTRSSTIAAILGLPARPGRPPRSELVLIDPAGGAPQTLLSVPGHLTGFLWSPDGSRLLVAWREFDEWLLIPAGGRHEGRRFGPISSEFSPGTAPAEAEFPQLEGWCCPKDAGGAP